MVYIRSNYEKVKNEICSIIEVLKSDDNSVKDFSSLNFISILGGTIIKVFAEFHGHRLENYLFMPKVQSFFETQGFYDTKERKVKAPYLLPFLQINSGEDVEKNTSQLKELICNYTNQDLSLVNKVSTVIGELLQNIFDHSGVRDEVVYNYVAGHYLGGGKGVIKIAIVDSGKGIFASLRGKYPGLKNAGEAIKKSIEQNVSGGRTINNIDGFDQQYTVNKGLGLFKTMNSLKELGGSLFIGSRDYLYCFDTETNTEELIKYENDRLWRGTFVILNINGTSETVNNINFENQDNNLGIDFDEIFK